MDNVSKDLATYLKSKSGLTRLMNSLKEKYISLSRYSGSITINNLTEEESVDISNLLGKKVDRANCHTSFKEIEKKIRQGKYMNFSWEALFKYYFSSEVKSKSDLKTQELLKEKNFFEEVVNENSNNKYVRYLKELIEDKDYYKILRKKYRKNASELKTEIKNILLLLENIPCTPISLPVYASLTGNPHYLDFNETHSAMFFKLLSYIREVEYPTSTKKKIDILSEINVYIDPISNYVITYQLLGNDILSELANKKQVINLNLLNIEGIPRLVTREKKVFIFENPSILNYLIKKIDIPIVITSGMPNLAVYKVLDKLVEEKNTLYYNGDFDPEGLLIANKLKERYKDLILFCYEDDDYKNSISDEDISESRLKKVSLITNEELLCIKNNLVKHKKSGYQESNLSRIEKYILNVK